MGIVAVVGAALTLILEVIFILRDSSKVKEKTEGEKLEIRKLELPRLADAIAKRDTTAYLLSLSRMRRARKE